MDNYNYPAGADNEFASWNQPGEQEEVKVDVLVSITLSKSTTIETNDYQMEEWEDSDIDDDGKAYYQKGVQYNFDDSNLKKAYEDYEFTIPEMLSILKTICSETLETCEDEQRKTWLEAVIKSTENWVVDEFEVMKD